LELNTSYYSSRIIFEADMKIIKDEVLLTVSCPIFPSISIAKNLLTGSLKNRSIDNLETQKKSISGDILFISFVIASGEAIIFYFEWIV
jgi:hypothetical protein